jgi:hypothetical protein
MSAKSYHPDPKFSNPTDGSRYGGWEVYLFQGPNEHSGAFGCYITDACLEVRGLAHADSCYELRLLYLFHKEYIAKLPDGEAVLGDYGRLRSCSPAAGGCSASADLCTLPGANRRPDSERQVG